VATSTASDEPRNAPARAAVGIVADEVDRRRLEGFLGWGSCDLVASAPSIQTLLDSGEQLDLVVFVGDANALATGAIQLLRALRPACSIVVVAPDDRSALVRKAFRAGVDGYLAESRIEFALAATISAVLTGQLAIPRSIRHRAPWSAFSARERQVLQLVADGATNQEIALWLHLAESTVKSHLASSFRKLGVSSRAEAATAVLDQDTGLQTWAMSTPTGSFQR
jgi:DNA-binding NarL/FixJ family response regulator